MERNIIESGGFYFIHNFDSGNLGNVERVPTGQIAPSVTSKFNTETPDYEFNIWTRPDCAGTEFENGNRTWFYFGVQASEPNVLVRLNLVNLNKQGKMYNQGMAPVTRTLPGRPQWERIKDRPVHTSDEESFTLSFKYRTCDNLKATTFFAFTYPYSFAELQIALNSIDMKMFPLINTSPDEVYYWRECLIYSLEGRRVDLLTITSHHGITNEREVRLKNLFPEKNERPFKFKNKKVVFISARVHPGETPSSFVFNGFLNLLLNRHDPVAMQLRKLYVFKLIPFLNPDGVARGHYRTDTRGVNLNRVYLNPSITLHPTVYASRALIRYYHYGFEKEDDCDDISIFPSDHSLSEQIEPMQPEPKQEKASTRPSSTLSTRKCNKASEVKDLDVDTPLRRNSKLNKETTNLVDQVYDLKIQESSSKETESLLTDDVLKSCLGSNVHLSTSEELNVHGIINPLRPLRDTLKNSISLLIDNGSGSTESKQTKPDKPVKIGWCPECQRSVNKLEDSMPGITSLVPGYHATHNQHQKYNSIEDYGEHQKQKMANMNSTDTNEKYFCTNCFAKYSRNEKVEMQLEPSRASTLSVAESGGDSGEVGISLINAKAPTPGSTGDADSNTHPRPIKESARQKSTFIRAPPKKKTIPVNSTFIKVPHKEPDSGLYLYIDLHGHASKKGIFMYGNHFDDVDSCVECMLLPRIMSLNNLHFHFSSCNFTERNMYLKDRRDGMSREGSGRVAVLKATGLVRSYTLECNYNTGRMVNVLPPPMKDQNSAMGVSSAPPKYNPHIYEDVKFKYGGKNLEVFEDMDAMQVGRSLGSSILDLTGHHPNSRIPCSEHRNIHSIREWLKVHTKNIKPQFTMSRIRTKTSPTRSPSFNPRPKGKVTEDRKENAFGTKPERVTPVIPTSRTGQDIIALNIKAIKKTDVKVSGRSLLEDKTKSSLSTKKRNILSIRKPNSKLQLSSGSKSKVRQDSDSGKVSLSGKISKRSFGRSIRKERFRGAASSSSSEVLGSWEHVAGGTVLDSTEITPSKRRNFATEPNKLKKMRLKAAI